MQEPDVASWIKSRRASIIMRDTERRMCDVHNNFKCEIYFPRV